MYSLRPCFAFQKILRDLQILQYLIMLLLYSASCFHNFLLKFFNMQISFIVTCLIIIIIGFVEKLCLNYTSNWFQIKKKINSYKSFVLFYSKKPDERQYIYITVTIYLLAIEDEKIQTFEYI